MFRRWRASLTFFVLTFWGGSSGEVESYIPAGLRTSTTSLVGVSMSLNARKVICGVNDDVGMVETSGD